MSNNQKTKLWPQHSNLGAKFTDFAGFDMPINYGSQLEEHKAVRTDAGIFDVSHMAVIDIKETKSGQAKSFLEYMLANDINKVAANKALYTCLCNEKGGIIDDLIVYNLGVNSTAEYRLVVNAGTKQKDFAWFEKHAKNFDVELSLKPELAIISVQGPNARTKAATCFPESIKNISLELGVFGCYIDSSSDWFVSRTGYTGEDGFEIVVPNSDVEDLWQNLVDSGITPCGLGARDTLRLEAGMNLYGHDMDESTTPYESGLTWTVALSESRDFIGKSALEQQKESIKQSDSKIQMIGLVLQDRGVLREGQHVVIANGGEGIITSGTFSPTLGVSIAIARVSIHADIKNFKTCEVMVRNKPLKANIVKYPFVRANKAVYKEY